MSGHPEVRYNGLFYSHNDHLGSPTVLMQKQGDVFVSSSIARFKPYGGYLGTPPTATTPFCHAIL